MDTANESAPEIPDDVSTSGAAVLTPGELHPGRKRDSFQALSYNVAGLSELISGEDPATHSPMISPRLNDYDLVLLQESWKDPVAEALSMGLIPVDSPEAPRVFGYHDLIVSDAEHPFQSEPAPHPLGVELRRGLDGALGPTILSDGLNRLSWFEFSDFERVIWRSCHGSALVSVLESIIDVLPLDEFLESRDITGDQGIIDDGSADCSAQKGFSVARHELAPGVRVDVYNLHADAGGHDRDLSTRVDNFLQMAEFLLHYSRGQAVILGGDTNLAFESDRRERRQEIDGGTWKNFQAVTGLTDVCDVLDCGDMDKLRSRGFKNHDRFAFRSGGSIELRPLSHSFERDKFLNKNEEPLSDHDPVAVTFEWKHTAPPKRDL